MPVSPMMRSPYQLMSWHFIGAMGCGTSFNNLRQTERLLDLKPSSTNSYPDLASSAKSKAKSTKSNPYFSAKSKAKSKAKSTKSNPDLANSTKPNPFDQAQSLLGKLDQAQCRLGERLMTLQDSKKGALCDVFESFSIALMEYQTHTDRHTCTLSLHHLTLSAF